MKKHTVYRIEHLPTNFNPLALAVWRYFNGSHDLLEVDGKLVFTDTDIDEINSDEFDPDTLSEIDDWNTFDSLRDFETWCLKVFAEHFGMRIREEELGDFDRICEHITVTPAR